MTQTISNAEVHTLAIDLAKTSFHIHAADRSGVKIHSKPVNRSKLIQYVSNLQPCTVVMEACGGANHFARKFTAMGHTVKLIAPQFVKPFVKSNKNDAFDAQAICEASQRPDMRFVSPKDTAQQDIQSIHRARSLVVAHRTALSNQIRGLLTEYGIVLPQGISILRRSLPSIIDSDNRELSILFRELLQNLYSALITVDQQVESFNQKIELLARQDERCVRLQTIPGIGPMAATALVATLGDGSAFKDGREASAYLGLVPRQNSTGGRSTLLGISKRGDQYLRSLSIHGGRAVVRTSPKHNDYRSNWITDLARRRNVNVASVAVANKNVRTAWKILQDGNNYLAA
ncbi:IS110 family transposase [Marinobacterium sp. xm-d-530]|uniref:IS110 family transposase n=1 Tax=Marinobacterium sp. xm-d-530 TaxID=2497747 RepID=UPI001569BABA|nr:IS110 family transposase [Marinobacterium sp. xm-d-530]NRQ01628.1 Transposase IS116/IS110/IS902 family protein [Marinobacterium sp. xm-d-530]